MKILIISYYFSPGNVIGAVRASKIAKYIEKDGYDVSVICGEDNKLLFMPEKIKIDGTLVSDTERINKTIISHSSAYKRISNLLKIFTKNIVANNKCNIVGGTKKSSFNSSLKKYAKSIIHFFTFVVSLLQDYDFYLRYKRHHKLYGSLDYDVIFSTYGPLSSHMVAKFLKKRSNSEIIWVADFRDPIAQPTNGWLEYKINKYFERKFCLVADVVTAVSKGYLNQIAKNSKVKQKYVITNGYDDDDFIKSSNLTKDTFFSFVYTGTTYGGRRDLRPIFKIIRELIDEKKIDIKWLKFRYAGPDQNIVYRLASEYELTDILDCYDFIPRIEALKLQAKSKILIVSTWNESQHTGVLPGKFLEYFMFKKPIIAIVNGSEKNSEIGEIIDEYKLGVCYEAINQDKNYMTLKEYIVSQYNFYLKNDYEVKYEGNIDKVEMHNYKSITRKYLKIFLHETKKRECDGWGE